MALALAGVLGLVLSLGLARRDLSHPAAAFGCIWFLFVALAQLRLTPFERPWSFDLTMIVFGGGLLFMLVAVGAAGLRPARGSFDIDPGRYRGDRLVLVAVLLLVGAVVGTAWKAVILGGVPLFSGQIDVLRARAWERGIIVPAPATFLTNGFHLGFWLLLAAAWTGFASTPGRRAALGGLAAVSLLGAASGGSRNIFAFTLAVPVLVVYLMRRGLSARTWAAVAAGALAAVLLVSVAFFVRVHQREAGRETFINREVSGLPLPARPFFPLYAAGVFPFAAEHRLLEAVPASFSYALGASSLQGLPDIVFPGGKPDYSNMVASVTFESSETSPFWTVATYQGRALADFGVAGVFAASILLGLALGGGYRVARGRPRLLAPVFAAYTAYYAAFLVYDNLVSLAMMAVVYDISVLALIERATRVAERRPAASDFERIRARATRLAYARHAGVAALVALIFVATLVILYAGRGLSFYRDEWSFVRARRGWTLDTFLQPANEHISVLPVLVFKILFVTAGLDDYWAYRVVLLSFHVVCVVLLFVLIRRRAGEAVALAAAALLLFLGSAFDDLLIPIQINVVAPVAAGLGTLLLLERRNLLSDVGACVLVLVAVGSSNAGLAIAGAALVEIALQRGHVWRRLWVPAVPVLLYGLWYVVYGGTELPREGSFRVNVTAVPGYVTEAAAGVLGGITGLGLEWGRTLLIAVVIFGLWRVRRIGASRPLITSLAAAVGFWALVGVARAHLGHPESSRYIYFGAAFFLLALAELLRGMRLSRGMLSVLAVGTAAAMIMNVHLLREGSRALRKSTRIVSAELAALELVGRGAPPDFKPDPINAFPIVAGPYLDAVEKLGSPADSLDELARKAQSERQAADAVLAAALEVHPIPAPRRIEFGPRPVVDGHRAGTVDEQVACIDYSPSAPGARLDFTVRGAGLVIGTEQETAVRIVLRRFATVYPTRPFARLPGPAAVTLKLPPSGLPEKPWHVRLRGITRPVQVCGIRSGDT